MIFVSHSELQQRRGWRLAPPKKGPRPKAWTRSEGVAGVCRGCFLGSLLLVAGCHLLSGFAFTARYQIHFKNKDGERLRADIGPPWFVGSHISFSARLRRQLKLARLIGALEQGIGILAQPCLCINLRKQGRGLSTRLCSASHLKNLPWSGLPGTDFLSVCAWSYGNSRAKWDKAAISYHGWYF